MSNMRLSNKEKALLKEFQVIQDFNVNLSKKFLIDNYIDNKYLTLGKKYSIDHNFQNTPLNYHRFIDIINNTKFTGLDVIIRLDLEIKPKYYSQIDSYFCITFCDNKYIESGKNNKINIDCCISLTIRDNNVLHSLEEINNRYNDIINNSTELLESFEMLKENYTKKFEEIKPLFKSYDEVFLKYNLMVKDWCFKNNDNTIQLIKLD